MTTAARYSITVLLTALALALSLALGELLAPMRMLLLWVAVMVSALVGGTRAGLLASALAALAGIFLFFGWRDAGTPVSATDVTRLALFCLFAGVISVAVGRTRTLTGKLRESELRYRTIVEGAPVHQAIWTATPAGDVRWAPEWAAITGQTVAELEAGGGMKTVHPEDAARTWERWEEALASGTRYEDEIRVRVATGQYRWFSISAWPILERGAITEWVGLATDIHDRKRHEDNAAFMNSASELLSSTLASQEAMRNLARLTVPALGDWCAIYLGHDENYERLVAIHSDPARVALIERWDTEVRPPAELDGVLRVLRTGRVELVENAPEEDLAKALPADQFNLVRQLGLHSWIIAPMIARGRTLGALAVVLGDSTRHYSPDDVPVIEELARRAAIALDNARLYEEAEAANRAKDEFLATLSHELRTPLTAISGWAHMLKMGIGDEETRNLAIDTIVRSAQSQGELIDDLLDLSRVVAGTLKLEVATVDLGKIVGEVLVAAKPAADAKNLLLTLSAGPEPILVRGDPRRLRQVVWNLVTNAVKFTDAGGKVSVEVDAEGTMARVVVADTGRGIEPAFLPYVWDRFRQADSSTSRQHGGLGLGLAVVRHLVEMHGGTVHARSEGAGRGSTFRVEIPLSHPVDGEETGVAGGSRADERMRGLRILLVEDDPDSRSMMTTMLTQYGAHVSAAASVAEAMWLLDAEPFDVAVSDIAMPGQDGYSFVEKTRSKVPTVAVSAMSTGAADRRRALDAGFADFVRKPVDPKELIDAIMRAIGG